MNLNRRSFMRRVTWFVLRHIGRCGPVVTKHNGKGESNQQDVVAGGSVGNGRSSNRTPRGGWLGDGVFLTHRVRLHWSFPVSHLIFILVKGRVANKTWKILVSEEVHLLISPSLKTTFEAV